MAGVLSDLHAADVRYHVDCRASFMCSRSIQAASHQWYDVDQSVDSAFNSLVIYLANNKDTIYSSIDLYAKYVQEGGNVLTRRQLIKDIIDSFGGEMIALSSPGFSTILVFKSTASKTFHMMPDDTDDMPEMIEKVSSKIKYEIENIEIDRQNYCSCVDKDICLNFQSHTLKNLLLKISEKLNQSLPALLIGNIVTSVVKNLATPLQIALAVQLRHSKALVKAFHDFGVTCSYDELLRFTKSVALNVNNKIDLVGLNEGETNLIQAIGDNFDQQIFSQNGKLQTHSMALLIAHSDSHRNEKNKELVPRLSKSEMTKEIPYSIDVGQYTGQKKPLPPINALRVKVPTLATLVETTIIVNRAKEIDLKFLKDVQFGCLEYNGYNTKKAREDGVSLQPKTNATYLPLIDMPPAEYDTILTSMLQVKRLSEASGQPFTVFTLDQQHYRYAVEIQWSLPDVFPPSAFLLRLGGMHMLMSFIGAVGNLMAETGLVDIMSPTFAGVHKMLLGKKFPMCMRALRMVVEVLLTPVLDDPEVHCHDMFMANLEARSMKSRTCKLDRLSN